MFTESSACTECVLRSPDREISCGPQEKKGDTKRKKGKEIRGNLGGVSIAAIKKQLRKERVYLAYTSILLFATEESQDRNSKQEPEGWS